jgi:hypothetical protein
VEFTADWPAPAEGHYCVVVRIPLYQLPANPSIVELTELNNSAQSNYDRFISASASPPTRVRTEFTVGNPYPIRTRIWLVPGQSNPLYRTYLEHSWLILDPGETRKVELMFEYAPDNLINRLYPESKLREYKRYETVANNTAATAYIEDPRDNPRHAIEFLGGLQAQVVTGLATRFDRFYYDTPVAGGKIVTLDNGAPVTGGKVVIRVSKNGDPKTFVYQQANVSNAGTFSASVKAVGNQVQAYYIPARGYDECESKVVRLKSRR